MASSDSANASPECRAIRCHFASLATAISDPLGLSMELFSKEIIEEVTMEKAKLPNLTDREKNSVLLLAVMRKVEARPSLFHQFVDILNDNGDRSLRELGEKLETTYSELHVPVNGECCLCSNKLIKYRLYDEGEVAARFIYRGLKA